ncbi:toll/interleukin-1 receptor domain-containing protein [Streptomyces sp. NRAIS4]
MESRPHYYDAFISYSHQRDVPLAEALQDGLRALLSKRITRNTFRARTKVFRDTTSLAACNDLSEQIKEALSRSRYFVYLASPEAAASRWVREEIAYRLANHPLDRMLIALSAGTIVWGEGDFDWSRTTALPEELRGAFSREPLWVDFRPFRDADHYDMSWGSPFRDRVATIAAPLHGLRKEELDSQDLHLQQKARRIWRVVGGFGAALMAGGLVAAGLAYDQYGTASARGRVNASRALADRSLEVAQSDPRKAAQFALYAYAVEPTGEAVRALGQAVAVNDDAVRHLQIGNEEVAAFEGAGHGVANNVAVSRDGGMLAYYSALDPEVRASQHYEVHLYDIRAQKALPSLKGKGWPQDSGGLAFSGNGKLLAVETPYNQVEIWDVAHHKLRHTITASDGERLSTAAEGLRAITLSDDGRRLAATFYQPTSVEGETVFRLAVWDTSSGRVLRQENVDPDSVSLVYDVQGRLHALDAHAGTVRILDPGARSWSAPQRLSGFPHRDNEFATLSADGTRAYLDAPSSQDKDELWDLAKGRRLATAASGIADFPVMTGGSGGALLGASTQGQQIAAYTTELRRRRVLGSFSFPVSRVAASGDGRWVAATSVDGAVTLFSSTSLRAGSVLSNPDHIKDSELTPDKRLAYRVGRDGTDLWSVTETGIRHLGHIPWRLDTTPDEARMTASLDGTRVVLVMSKVASLWNPRSGEHSGIPVTAADYIPVTFLPNDQDIVAVKGNTLVVQKPGTWDIRQSLPLKGGTTEATAVSADRATVAVLTVHAPDVQVLTVWHWTQEKGFQQVQSTRIKTAGTFERSVSVSPHGERVTVVNADKRLSTLDVASGHVTYSTAAKPTGRIGAAFSSDGALLVQAYGSGSGAGLQFWNSTTGDDSGTWATPDEGRADTSPDLFNGPQGSVLALGDDGTLVRSTIDVAAWRSTLCALSPGQIPSAERKRYLSGIDFSEPCYDGD